MATMRKNASPLKAPRLRMKDELLKTAPELAKLIGEEVEDPEKEFHSVHRLDTPRSHEEERTEEEELRLELEAVKRERAVLIQSLAHIKTDLVGSGGGEAQYAQIDQLEKELELKKLKLNELRTEDKRLANGHAELKNKIKDAYLLIPRGYQKDVNTIKALHADIKRLEDDLIEAEAKNRLYYLLAERTRADHMDMERKVRDARERKEHSLEDYAALTQHMHNMRAAKEDSEKQLSKMRRMFDDARKDWNKKMKDRNKEVQELRRRQEKEELREQKKKEKQEEEARKEREKLARVKVEQEAYEMQIQELAPKIEAMEASWNRLRTISGADLPEEVIAYWEGLKAKEENMRTLVKQAEESEAHVKARIVDLIQQRNQMLEADVETDGCATDDGEIDAAEERIAAAHRNMETTRKKFEKLRTVCLCSEQGLKSVLDKLSVGLGEADPADIMPESTIPIVSAPPRKAQINRNQSVQRKTVSPYARRSGTPSTKPGTAASEASAERLESMPRGEMLTLTQPKSTIDDAAFFESLPALLANVREKAERLVEVEADAVEQLREAVSTAAGSESDDDDDDGDVAAEAAVAEQDTMSAAEAAADGEKAPGEGDKGEAVDADVAAGDGANGRDEGPAGDGEGGSQADATEERAAEPAAEADEQGQKEGAAAGEAEVAAEAAEPAADADGDQAAEAPAADTETAGQPEEKKSGNGANGPSTATLEDAVSEAPAETAVPAAPENQGLLSHVLENPAKLDDAEIERRMLMMSKAMPKMDWSGAPMLAVVNPELKGLLPDLSAVTKKTKGKKRQEKPVHLSRIVGYTDEAGPEPEEDEEANSGEDDDENDGVLERDLIKRMAAKMEARAAKERAERDVVM